MRITKSVEQFDCSVFKVGTSYYIKSVHKDKIYKGIFICTQINYPFNEVMFYRVVNLCGAENYQCLILNKECVDMVKIVEPVTYFVEVSNKTEQGILKIKWNINANIIERAGDDD